MVNIKRPEYKLENISYDQNGNLQSLKRYAAPINSTTAHLLDNLTTGQLSVSTGSFGLKLQNQCVVIVNGIL